MVTSSTFREHFPEFDSVIKYPDGMVNFWLGIADKVLMIDRWADTKDFGVELFTAHQITIAKSNLNSEATGGLSGQNLGPANSKAVGEVSVGYDTNMSMEAGAGHWNLSSYGKQFIRLARMIGAGAVQL
jgi:hypothetical protein